MELTVVTASILGPIMLLLGIGYFVNTKYYKNIAKELKNKHVLLEIVSILGMVTGSYLVANHNVLEGTAELLISIIGWIMLLKSSFMLALPNTFLNLIKNIKFSSDLIKALGIIYILLGLYFTNYAYYGVL